MTAHQRDIRGVRGFTLIELLVTLGIVVVLAALVFTSFSKIKESGQRSKCAANLKQIGIAATQYAADNNGAYPYTYDLILGIHNPVTPGLIDLLGDYVNDDYRVFYCTDVVHCLPPPALAKDMTYQALASAPGRDRFSTIGYNWFNSTSRQWPAPPQKILGSGKRILASCFTFGGGTVHNRVHNILFADGHVDQRKTHSNGTITAYIDYGTLLWDDSVEPY